MENTAAGKQFFGWSGKILRVDLSGSRIWEEPLSDELANNYIGGAGINARILYELTRENPKVDPLAPESPLIIGCGVTVGTSFPCNSRFTVTAKSPLTGIFGDSNGGGWFPARMKQAGYDHIVIQGRADKPVALVIEQGKTPALVDAADLWGLDTYATDAKIQQKFGRCESVRIGPAGENLVAYANIFSGTKRTSCAGRAGMGCVMGSKKLKAVVVKAEGKVAVADEARFDALVKSYQNTWGKGPSTGVHKEYGSLMLIAQNIGQTRTRNQQEPITDEQKELSDITDIIKIYKTGQTACYRCPVACTQTFEVKEGPYKGARSDKLEYGHWVNMAPLLGFFDFAAVVHLTDLSNRLGMDCVQFGWNLAMAMECFQRGIIGTQATGGLELVWGDVKLIAELMEQAGRREGFGDLLAGSMPQLLSKLPPEAAEYGFHTKGMSFSYNTSQAIPLSLASSVATRGADHLKGHPFAALVGIREMLERPFGKDLPEEILDHTSPVAKGRVVWWSENYKTLMDCLGICFVPVVSSDIFGDPHMLFEEMGEIYQAATGRDPATLFEAAERIYQLEKSYNAMLGIDRKDDYRRGTRRGQQDPMDHPDMLDEYYHYRGCSDDGLPTRKRLEEVGLTAVADNLAQNGRLADQERPAIGELLV
ncbi:MAG: aldehyde ferredoxin oxidoreductase family protein [Deltaproteobacteria bacterium]|nr:aldehyde ferredoxin oxidoreductase family protein [Deltaproteobacteria bacterium]